MERLKNYIPLNWELMAHPANWVIIFLMVYIAGLAIHLVFPTANVAGIDEGNDR